MAREGGREGRIMGRKCYEREGENRRGKRGIGSGERKGVCKWYTDTVHRFVCGKEKGIGSKM